MDIHLERVVWAYIFPSNQSKIIIIKCSEWAQVYFGTKSKANCSIIHEMVNFIDFYLQISYQSERFEFKDTNEIEISFEKLKTKNISNTTFLIAMKVELFF